MRIVKEIGTQNEFDDMKMAMQIYHLRQRLKELASQV